LDISLILISLIGGFFAGMLNAIAGFGSIITLAIYMDVMGIPAHLANATNRVNVLASSSISAFTFHKYGKLDISNSKWIIAACTVGAMVGVYMAVNIDADGFKKAFKYFLVLIFIFLLLNPKKFIKPDLTSPPLSKWLMVPLFFMCGIYAGFIQAGFGVVFLMIIVVLGKYELISANALKILVVAFYTVIVLSIFHFQGMVNWKAGLMLAVGQGLGGFVVSKNASLLEGANKYAYYVLIVIVGLVIVKNFELWQYFNF